MKNTWRFVALLGLLSLASGCVIIHNSDSVEFDKDLSPEQVDSIREIAEQGTFAHLPLLPSLFIQVEGYSRYDRQRQDAPIVSACFTSVLLNLYVRTKTSKFHPASGKRVGEKIGQAFLWGLFTRWENPPKNNSGWSLLWGIFNREVRDGESKWVFFRSWILDPDPG